MPTLPFKDYCAEKQVRPAYRDICKNCGEYFAMHLPSSWQCPETPSSAGTTTFEPRGAWHPTPK